jgi:hypothetical protein
LLARVGPEIFIQKYKVYAEGSCTDISRHPPVVVAAANALPVKGVKSTKHIVDA